MLCYVVLILKPGLRGTKVFISLFIDMDSLKDIIERCHQRHENPLRQRKTVVAPALYNKGYPYQFTVYCAQRYPILLADLEQADISFMPIGHAPDNDRGPRDFGGERFLRRQGAQDWGIRRWHGSWGIQIYTGVPSEHNGARWHDIHFRYEVISTAPNAVFACIDTLVNSIDNPLLTLSKSGGLRFSCRVPDYLHPNTEDARLYIYKYTPTPENPHQRDVYLEILGQDGYSIWDARYEILLGNLFDPPVVAKEVLFAPIDALRAELHEPTPREVEQNQIVANVPQSLGSRNLDLAKEAFVNRGFSYVRQENGFHHWMQSGSTVDNDRVLLWERDGTVWVRAFTSNTGLPTKSTSLTQVWDDTGIVSLPDAAELPVSDKILAVRKGKLSPLAIKRPPTVLHKTEGSEENDETPDESPIQTESIFNKTARILGLITNIGAGSHEAASYLLNSGTVCMNMPAVKLADRVEKRFQEQNIPSYVRWKPRMYRWEEAKEIPVDIRMAAPFQHGNVCEDPERCDALEEKGGDPSKSICPQCPVYAECQQRGYLSQLTTLQRAKGQILTCPQLFFDPQYAELVEEILKQIDETERVCVVGRTQVHNLFPTCKLSRELLEEWSLNWRGCALGNFAKALLHAIEIEDKPHADAVKRIRSVIGAFEWREEEIVKQMSHVNVRGKVVERGFTDSETDKPLARLTIEFEGGPSAYIPLDDTTADKLVAKGLPIFRFHSFVPNEDLKILMSMAQAIRLGILDAETVENIQEFPTVCQNPDWTFWHQLKRFFAHYTRDADAPIRWNGSVLRFWIPPVLHPSIKRFMLMSATLPEQHLRRAFPNEEVRMGRTKPVKWGAGNRVFQIRTGIYPQRTIFDYNGNRDVIGLSETGVRIFGGIRAEIERDPSVKHAIVTYESITAWLDDIAEKGNVRFVTDFEVVKEHYSTFGGAQVVWIVGTPQWPPDFVWCRAQILFGNDEKPLSYEEEMTTRRYKDERIQNVYGHGIARVLTRAVLQAGLNRSTDKKIVLVSSLPLPNITDSPETLLFDWEDFEVAGGLDKLPEVVATRERFETERDNLTAESSREEVEKVLGCSSRQANRLLQKLRGGKPLRVPFRQQILSILASDGEKKTSELVTVIEGHPKAIKNELSRLVEIGEIVRIRWGVYALPSE